jgi:redox-sensing transcriptional repressor
VAGERTISSQELAHRFQLSATQIRKDLAQFGEFGIRGVGYDVEILEARLKGVLGLDREHRLIVIGAGNLGQALVRFLGAKEEGFRVVAVLDKDPGKVGRRVGGVEVQPSAALPELVRRAQPEIGVLAVPPDAAQENYDALVTAGVRAVLNFASINLRTTQEVPTKNVDLRIHLEELAFLVRAHGK